LIFLFPFLILFSEDDIKVSKAEIHGADYHLVSANLRNLKEVESKLQESGIDKTLPTVFITECVLVYVDIDSCNNLLKWTADNFPVALFLNYEQVGFIY